MVEIGYALSSEDHTARDLVRFAVAAEEAGFRAAWVSDHYHPWVSAQGESPFVWSVVGGIAAATERLRLGTGVTCPTIRIHPAILAQATATSAEMLPGRFFFGIGSGERLNEHILGDRWPPAPERLDMLAEAMDVIRKLWTGENVTHDGQYYVVENARLYTLPDEPPPVYMSAFGPKAVSLAAEIADGFIGTSPEAKLVRSFRDQAGGDRPCLAGTKACWAESEDKAQRTVYELWPNLGLPGELSQELATVEHFEQAVQLVDQSIADTVPCGPDPERHAGALRAFAEAGYDEVYVHQIGADQAGFLRFYRDEVIPRL
jgi:G6PDH family F420-dependent oxidoreductase